LRELLLQKNEADLFHHLLAEPLTGLIWREQRLVVVIDALDEATDEHGRNALVDLLVTRLATLPAWLAFVVTSRPNPDVVAKLAGYAPFEFDPHEARNHNDLQAYLHTVLGRRADFLACSVQEQERIFYRLLELSEGMILYLRQLVQGLEEGAITLAALDRIPPGLASLYRINFEHKYGGERIGVYDSEVRPLLRLLVAAPGPMPAELARTALGWDRETYASRRNLLGSNVIDMPQGLRLFHQSLYEWLAKIDSSPFYVDADEGALMLGNFLWKCCSETGDDDEIQWAPQVQHWLPELLPRMPLWNCIDPLRWMGNYLLRMKRFASGERLLRRVLHLAEATEGPLSMAAATAQKDLARLLSAGGDTKGAAAFFSQAFQIQQQLLGPRHREVARTATELAHAVFPINRIMLMNYREGCYLGPELDWTVPEQMFQMVVNIHEQGSEPQDLAAAHLDLGYVLEILGRLDEAERYYRLALEVEHKGTELRNDWPARQRLDDLKRWRERLVAREQQYEEVAALEAKYGPKHQVVEEALHSIARNVQSIGWEAAAPLYERVLQIREQRLGVAHEDVADLLSEMAYWAEDENLKETLESRALSIREQVLGQDHAQLLDSLRMLGHYRDRAGDFAAAEALWCRALAIMERDEGPFGKEVAYMLGLLAGLQHKRGHYAAAVELRQRVLAIREARLQEDHSSLHDVEDALSELGKSLSRCCDFIAAEAVLRRALALSHECYGQRFVDGGPYAARNFRELGLVLSAQGDYAGAAPLLRRAVEGYERWLEIDSPHKLGNLADALESLVGVLQVQQQHGDVKRLRERACTLLAQAKAAGYSPEHPALQMLQSLAFPANEEEKPNQ
jgi:tetratricopeptide (TPR) repeat protein